MNRILTEDEYLFLTELADLIKKYDVFFTHEQINELTVTVGIHSEKDEAYDKGRTAIYLPPTFDHEDIEIVLESTCKHIGALLKAHGTDAYNILVEKKGNIDNQL